MGALYVRCVVAFKQSAAGVGHAVVVGVEPHTPAPEQVGVYAVRDVPVAQIEAGVGHAVVVGVEPHTPAPEQVGVYAVRDVPTQIEAGVGHTVSIDVEPHDAPEQTAVYARDVVPTQIEAGVEHEFTAGDSSTVPSQSSSMPLQVSVVEASVCVQLSTPAPVQAYVPAEQRPASPVTHAPVVVVVV